MRVSQVEAAGILGVSVDTVQRRIKRGQLVSVREETPAGVRVFVEIEDPAPSPQPAADAPQRTVDAPQEAAGRPADAVQELLAAVQAHNASLQAEVVLLAEQLEARTREVSELHVLLQRVQAAALPAPASTTSEAPIAAESAPQRPWWRFW